jgi:SAM-dependent methyltransferase
MKARVRLEAGDAVEAPDREIAVQFSRFAPYYDRFMHKYVNYKGWANYVLRIFRHYQVKPKVLLDLACGSGIPTMLLAREGYRIYGVDRSETMLDILRGKIGDRGSGTNAQHPTPDTRSPAVIPILADMREFSLPEPVDAAISLYDSINYLLAIEDVEKTFACAFRQLASGGAFIFDMNTEYSLREIWGSRTMRRNEGGVVSVWKNEFDPATGICTLFLSWFTREDGAKKEHSEIHREKAYKEEEIRSALEKAGFGKVSIYAHPTFQPPFELTPRIMVVALK